MKRQFLSCAGHISSPRPPHVADGYRMDGADAENVHHGRMRYWTALSLAAHRSQTRALTPQEPPLVLEHCWAPVSLCPRPAQLPLEALQVRPAYVALSSISLPCLGLILTSWPSALLGQGSWLTD